MESNTNPAEGKLCSTPRIQFHCYWITKRGCFKSVKDISVAELRANTTALAKLATLHNIPVITTASVPDGPTGPLIVCRIQ